MAVSSSVNGKNLKSLLNLSKNSKQTPSIKRQGPRILKKGSNNLKATNSAGSARIFKSNPSSILKSVKSKNTLMNSNRRTKSSSFKSSEKVVSSANYQDKNSQKVESARNHQELSKPFEKLLKKVSFASSINGSAAEESCEDLFGDWKVITLSYPHF